MLLKVGIDPDAGYELASSDARVPARYVTRQLRERCLLALDSPRAVRDLLEAFKEGGSGELAQVVAQLVNAGRIEIWSGKGPVSPAPLHQIETPDAVATWRGVADLLLVAELRASVLQDHEIKMSPEVASVRSAPDSDAFERLDRRWDLAEPKGRSREEVWRAAFAPLAKHSTVVYLIDGYFANDVHRTLKASAHRGLLPGNEWFIGRLARSGAKSIRVVCSARHVRKDRLKPDEVAEDIRNWFDKLGTGSSLDLHFVEGDFVHGRRLAFDGWAGFELHHGLATFDGAALSETVSLHASLELARRIREEYGRLCS